MRDLFAFIGVDPLHPIDLSLRHNETMVPHFPALAGLRRWILPRSSLPAWLPGSTAPAMRTLYNRRRNSLVIDPDDRRLVVDY